MVCCGRDVNVNGAITTTNGSVLLDAGRDIRVFHAMTTTDGNIALCAGHDLHIDAAITLTRGSTIPAQSLGLPVGLTLIAGAAGTGPGVDGGTVIFAPLSPPATVTAAPAEIHYNPVSYAAPADYSTNFVLTEGATLTQKMLLFPNGDQVFDGSNDAVLDGFNTTDQSGVPTGVTLVAGPDATATYDNAEAGSGIGITYSGYTLAGEDADQYALAGSCCTTDFRTTGTISSAPPPPATTPPPTTTPPPATTPFPSPIVVTTPLLFAPVLASAPPSVALAVLDTGVRMPVIESLAEPVSVEESAPPPSPPRPAPPPKPVYPRKQARH